MTGFGQEMAAGPGPACSDWARAQGLAPVGSAGCYQGFLLVEQPLPWPADVAEVAELVGAAAVAAAANLRLQAVVGQDAVGHGGPGRPSDDERKGARRVICYQLAGQCSGLLSRSEALAAPGSLAEVAAALLSTGREAGAAGQVVDVLVCTHGRRDSCCGARGTDLFGQLVAEPFQPGPVRLWRTSHTGGHRFAPTAIVLPSATLWAWADRGLLERVVNNQGTAAEVLGRYRGYACLGSPAQQAVERAVLGEVGWPLLRSRRAGQDLGDGRVRLETSAHGTWEATAREGRRAPQPDCRTDPSLATKFSVEWSVEGLRQVAPG